MFNVDIISKYISLKVICMWIWKKKKKDNSKSTRIWTNIATDSWGDFVFNVYIF